ncbi:hypothetical protein PR048_030915 [Dryococelus australis]|uniref:Uncharacterized protein n=1 Tax=Dryococelus australis TaxID=614101 RepID=A0ABQ9GA97_9NEOP|nr:hypothetical protein PR048_030915 [Dryococelus australis]
MFVPSPSKCTVFLIASVPLRTSGLQYARHCLLTNEMHCHFGVISQTRLGTAVAERLDCSPPTEDLVGGNRAGPCCWSEGFLGDLPFPHPGIPALIQSRLISPSSALKTSCSIVTVLTDVAQFSLFQVQSVGSPTPLTALCAVIAARRSDEHERDKNRSIDYSAVENAGIARLFTTAGEKLNSLLSPCARNERPLTPCPWEGFSRFGRCKSYLLSVTFLTSQRFSVKSRRCYEKKTSTIHSRRGSNALSAVQRTCYVNSEVGRQLRSRSEALRASGKLEATKCLRVRAHCVDTRAVAQSNCSCRKLPDNPASSSSRSSTTLLFCLTSISILSRALIASRLFSSFSRMKGREIPEKIRRLTASSGTIPTCENPVTRPGIEPGSPWLGASVLTAQPPVAPIFRKASEVLTLPWTACMRVLVSSNKSTTCCVLGDIDTNRSCQRRVEHSTGETSGKEDWVLDLQSVKCSYNTRPPVGLVRGIAILTCLLQGAVGAAVGARNMPADRCMVRRRRTMAHVPGHYHEPWATPCCRPSCRVIGDALMACHRGVHQHLPHLIHPETYPNLCVAGQFYILVLDDAAVLRVFSGFSVLTSLHPHRITTSLHSPADIQTMTYS